MGYQSFYGCLCKGCLEHFERFSVIGAPGKRGVLAVRRIKGMMMSENPTMKSANKSGKA